MNTIDIVWILPVMLVMLLLKGFFSGSEIALVNADKIKLSHRAKQGSRGARLVVELFKRPRAVADHHIDRHEYLDDCPDHSGHVDDDSSFRRRAGRPVRVSAVHSTVAGLGRDCAQEHLSTEVG